MPSDDIDHWHIDAIVFKDRVEETHYISNPAKKVRRQQKKISWHVEKFLGRGGFGEVRLERNKEDSQTRAVKRIAMVSNSFSDSECVKELRAMLEFSKPKFREAAVFVDFHGWFRDGSDIYFAMEYFPLGDLETNVVALSGKIPENEARDIAEQILYGLEIMHAESFAHRDLKPQNILVVAGPPQWWIKLGDFGLSKRLTETSAFHTRSGTQLYMAPELLNYLANRDAGSDYTNAVDIWAAGCIVYRLVAGCVPFPPGTSLMKYCEDKSLFPYDELFDCSIKSQGFKFIRQLLVANPQDRPSATQALRSPWISAGKPSVTAGLDSSPLGGGPSIKRKSLERAQAHQAKGPTDSPSTVSDSGNYNTASHAGLKSYQSLSPDLPDVQLRTMPPSSPIIQLSSTSDEVTVVPLKAQPDGQRKLNASQEKPIREPAAPTSAGNEMHDMLIKRDTHAILSELEDAGQTPEVLRGPIDGNRRTKGKIPELPYESETFLPPGGNDLPIAEEFRRTKFGLPSRPHSTGEGSANRTAAKTTVKTPDSLQSLPIAEEFRRSKFGLEPIRIVNPRAPPTEPKTVTQFPTRARAIYDYYAREKAELSINKGDILLVVKALDQQWWQAINGTTVGKIPMNYVQPIPVLTTAEIEEGGITHVKAVLDFSPIGSDELKLRKGDIVRLKSSAADQSWWYGEVVTQRHGLRERRQTVGLFPLDHVEIITPKPSDPASKGIKNLLTRDTEADVPEETKVGMEDASGVSTKRVATAESVKPMSLKGLFSVSTPSTKPFIAIRRDIIRVLRQLEVEYTEIPGGFSCQQSPSPKLRKGMRLDFEIFIVKVPLLALHGIQFKKLAGETWHYKSMADQIVQELRL